MTARDEVLARLRAAIRGTEVPPPPPPGPAPSPQEPGADADPATQRLFAERLVEYGASISLCQLADLPATVASALPGVGRLAAPADLPAAWLGGYSGVVLRDGRAAPLDSTTLDAADAALTGCAVAIAETGTIVLDAGSVQGRRVLSLMPDRHVCVVFAAQLVATVPEAFPRLVAARPLTWISGPSATSDIELDRVEGVHGPRALHIVLISDDAYEWR